MTNLNELLTNYSNVVKSFFIHCGEIFELVIRCNKLKKIFLPALAGRHTEETCIW